LGFFHAPHRTGNGQGWTESVFQFPLLGIFPCTSASDFLSAASWSPFNSLYLGFFHAPTRYWTICVRFQKPTFNSLYLGFFHAPL